MANTRFSVALHVLGLLAWRGQAMNSTVIARSVGTHPVVVRRLLAGLTAAGLVASRRGPGGGTALARDPEEITLLDVYRASGEPEQLPRHPDNPRCPFLRTHRRGLDATVQHIESGFRDVLVGRSLADVLEVPRP